MKTIYTINNIARKGAMSGLLFLSVMGLSSCNYLDLTSRPDMTARPKSLNNLKERRVL